MGRIISRATAIKLGLYPQPKEQPAMDTPARPLNENFLTHLLTGVSYEEAPYVYTACVNALTSRIVWSLAGHFGALKRITDHIPTLDERNEKDYATAGEEFARTYVRPAQGHDEQMTPYEIAQTCERLRNTIFEELRESYALEPAKEVLVRNYTAVAERPPFWPLPQSIEGYLMWQIRSKAGLNPDQQRAISFANSTYGEDIARRNEEKIKRDNATRAAQYKELAREILTEVISWDSPRGENFNVFTMLPVTTQVEIAESIQNALFNRSISILNQSGKTFSELESECNLVRGLSVKAAAWLNQPTIKHFRGVIATRNSNRPNNKRTTNPLLEKPEITHVEDDGNVASMTDDVPA